MAKINKYNISADSVAKIIKTHEGQFSELKAREIKPANMSRTVSAFANSDGGDLFVGILEYEDNGEKIREWVGFDDDEAVNGHLQVLESIFPLGEEYICNFLSSDGNPGIVLHLEIRKTKGIVSASDDLAYIRRGAQNLPAKSAESLKKLEYLKGQASFETEVLNDVPVEFVTESDTVAEFVTQVVPETSPEAWVKKQLLMRNDSPTVAGILLFGDEPQAALPKRCGVKIYRYKTSDEEGTRETLAFDPITVEGPLYKQIIDSVEKTTELVEEIPKLAEGELQHINYPKETLHEIITNAVIHRDYSIPDDVHIRIFDNRIEVQSPGKLPAHMTIENILSERAARNGITVRILNKFPNPPNKDVGEGLNTAFNAMHSLGLKEPIIRETETSVLVTIKHEQLASPEETILKYLNSNDSINNSKARSICHIPRDNQVKVIFNKMMEKKVIERVPGTNTSSTAYRLVKPEES